jgi:hypothetical protein
MMTKFHIDFLALSLIAAYLSWFALYHSGKAEKAEGREKDGHNVWSGIAMGILFSLAVSATMRWAQLDIDAPSLAMVGILTILCTVLAVLIFTFIIPGMVWATNAVFHLSLGFLLAGGMVLVAAFFIVLRGVFP